jgi:hypothetical protein
LRLADVPPGAWRVVWWDTLNGVPSPAAVINHPGGWLELPVPPINRHAAVALTREKTAGASAPDRNVRGQGGER